MEAQLNVRRNQEEAHESFADLRRWVDDIKKKDAELIAKKGSAEKSSLPPVRGSPQTVKADVNAQTPKADPSVKKPSSSASTKPSSAAKAPAKEKSQEVATKKSVEQTKSEPKKVEAPKVETPKVETPKVEAPKVETPKVETPKVETPKVETPKVESEPLKTDATLALAEKETGNEHFKNGKYEEAVQSYSRSILLDPSSHVAYSNRAMAYLKLDKFQLAYEDCNRSISIDPKFVKSYTRRATALRGMNRLEDALAEFEFALTLEPGNASTKAEISKTKDMMKTAAAAAAAKKPAKKMAIEDVEEEQVPISPKKIVSQQQQQEQQEQQQQQQQQQQQPIQESPSIANASPAPKTPVAEPAKQVQKPKTRFEVIEDEEETLLPTKSTSNEPAQKPPMPALQETQTSTPTSQEKPSPVAQPKSPSPVIATSAPVKKLQPPKTYYEFERGWKELKSLPNESFYNYFCEIEPASYNGLFKDSLQPIMISAIAHTLNQYGNPGDNYTRLSALCKVSRFSFNIAMVDSKGKAGGYKTSVKPRTKRCMMYSPIYSATTPFISH
eukprot:TRINITY_DN9208_c0_g1_i6.p1 TRINITY_DN9208_c0_g1~~TRINITY_DN9208_c0_g1_i6.p1  ORF type:complete len:556 (+),score=135.61 TRINITY_DN9208_c0_g1_i6:61-1728(+)